LAPKPCQEAWPLIAYQSDKIILLRLQLSQLEEIEVYTTTTQHGHLKSKDRCYRGSSTTQTTIKKGEEGLAKECRRHGDSRGA